jgi:hypothetical protein
VPVEEKYYIPPLFSETISDIYTKIERVVGDADRCDTVEIHYDSEWHYPKYFKIKWARRGTYTKISIEDFIVDPQYP